MGVEVRSSNYRLRTIWTPEMDRYFVDLMLEQVDRGRSRDDHLFSKRGWNHMSAMFNSKFNSNYETDVLKNRHKMLRNLFRAIRNLLGQKGFSWDESRQMVTADNRVWDDYIQGHPDARPYRTKTVPYYSDLFEIYGASGSGSKSSIPKQKADYSGNTVQYDGIVGFLEDTQVVDTSVNYGAPCSNMIGSIRASEMANEPLHDITIDEDYDVSVAKGMVDETAYQFLSDIGSTIGTRTRRTYWQPPMDRYFVTLLLEQVNKGNHVDGLLRKHAWREMISSFNDNFEFSYGVDILKNRFKTLRTQHNVINNLLKMDGFAWDDARQMLVADDPVWQNHIKAHAEARQYMTRPVPYFKDLCLIFRELNDDDNEKNLENHAVDQSPSASVSSYEGRESTHQECDIIIAANPVTKRRLETPPFMGSSKKSRSEDEGVKAVPVELVVASIQALPDMDEDLVLDACDFLEDDKKAKTFLALDVKLRKKWLIRKIRPSQ
ncbi:hypothetical protein ACP275_04G011200 [Erythranthe tilingii]